MTIEKCRMILENHFDSLTGDLTGQVSEKELAPAMEMAHKYLSGLGYNDVLHMAAEGFEDENAYSPSKSDILEDLECFLVFTANSLFGKAAAFAC